MIIDEKDGERFNALEERINLLEKRLAKAEKSLLVVKRSLSVEEEDYCDVTNGEHITKPGQEFCLCGKEYYFGRVKKDGI